MDKEYLRKYLSTGYQGGQSFLDTIIIPIFGNNFEDGYNKEDFDKPKVVYMEIQTDNPEKGYPFPCYSYDEANCVVLNTAYIMSSKSIDTKYILGVLNSRLGKFLTKLYVIQLQERQFRMLAQYVANFPIVIPSESQKDKMIELVQDVLDNHSNISEERVDQLTFELYGLSMDEIDFLTGEH